ncbi:MAG: GNAT family N-acetyltransferase [Chloroflexi bacterium]|nr:GNAT family N-acetyltransferase [Chloroflexota bacterium]
MKEVREMQGKRIYLKRPTVDDYLLVKDIWEDEETMEDVGGICELSKERYEKWYNRIFVSDKNRNCYYLVFENKSSSCCGEVSFHQFDELTRRAMFNIKIVKKYRGLGYGKESMDLILDEFFRKWNGEVMEDTLWEKNPNGLNIIKKYGFKEVKRDEEGIWVELNRKEWEIIKK